MITDAVTFPRGVLRSIASPFQSGVGAALDTAVWLADALPQLAHELRHLVHEYLTPRVDAELTRRLLQAFLKFLAERLVEAVDQHIASEGEGGVLIFGTGVAGGPRQAHRGGLIGERFAADFL